VSGGAGITRVTAPNGVGERRARERVPGANVAAHARLAMSAKDAIWALLGRCGYEPSHPIESIQNGISSAYGTGTSAIQSNDVEQGGGGDE